MTGSLDFILLPILRRQGEDQPALPGLHASLSPRRAGRGRSQDRLVMHLALQGNAPLSPKAFSKLLDSLGQTYFKSTGSSTAAMRVVAESLNQSLFSRNQRGSSRGMRSLGLFTLAVFRYERLYLAQCGAAHAFLIRANGLQHFHDPSTVGRGLGMGRATPIQYHQAEVAAGDLLIISPAPPVAWHQTLLQSMYGRPLEQVHPQLLQHAGEDAEAVLIQISAGNGQLRTLRPESKAAKGEMTHSPVETPQIPVAALPPLPRHPPEISESVPPQRETAPPKVAPSKSNPAVQQPSVVVVPAAEATPAPQEVAKPPKPKREPLIGPALLTFSRAAGTTLRQFFITLGTLIRRMLPDEKMLDLPPAVMLFGAIAIPLMVVAVAGVVYAREGRGRMYQEKFPHWVVVTGADESFFYVHDPFVDREKGKSDTDCVDIPITKTEFESMARYGKAAQQAAVIIGPRSRGGVKGT